MGISGAWKQKNSAPYASELKQGTGWNRVHASRNAGLGRGIADHESVGSVDDVTADFQPDNYGYTSEDEASTLWGANAATGMADHRNLGETGSGERNDTPQVFPAYGPTSSGVPGGGVVRSINRGADLTVTAKAQQPEWFDNDGFKRYGAEPIDAIDPSSEQPYIQTSMVQRDKSRNGSQTTGRANASRAPIGPRVPGPKIPNYSRTGSYRHDEMTPKRQDTILRRFTTRTAGTADPSLMDVNAMYQSQPRQREPVGEPFTGDPVEPSASQASDVYGYTSEDMLPYV